LSTRSEPSRRQALSEPKITATLISDYISEHRSPSPLDSLTSRERNILQLVVEGSSSAQVADILAFSPKTVDTYRSRIKQKLGIHDLPALVKFAIQHGYHFDRVESP